MGTKQIYSRKSSKNQTSKIKDIYNEQTHFNGLEKYQIEIRGMDCCDGVVKSIYTKFQENGQRESVFE